MGERGALVVPLLLIGHRAAPPAVCREQNGRVLVEPESSDEQVLGCVILRRSRLLASNV